MVEYMKRNFEIVRGTKKEIDEMPTKDMTMYLAWDTNQIFFGNSEGVKTPYNNEKKIYDWVNYTLETFEQEIYGTKGTICLDPEDFIKDDEKGYKAAVCIDKLTSSDWIQIRPMSRLDSDLMFAYNIFYSTNGHVVEFSTENECPDVSINFEYFITKGI